MHPSASSYFLLFFYFRFPHIKSAPKIQEKSDKKLAYGNLPESPGWGQRATTRDPGALVARPRAWSRQGGAWAPSGPPGYTVCLYITPVEETLRIEVFFPISSLYFRRRRFKIGLPGDAVPAPCRREEHLRELLHRHGRFPDVP